MPTNEFRHSPDNIIYITNNGVTLRLQLAEFLTYEPDYELPAPHVWQWYVPSQNKHNYFDPDGNQIAAPLPWPDGDRYIENIADYQASL